MGREQVKMEQGTSHEPEAQGNAMFRPSNARRSGSGVQGANGSGKYLPKIRSSRVGDRRSGGVRAEQWPNLGLASALPSRFMGREQVKMEQGTSHEPKPPGNAMFRPSNARRSGSGVQCANGSGKYLLIYLRAFGCVQRILSAAVGRALNPARCLIHPRQLPILQT
jgi:hypothetical protein